MKIAEKVFVVTGGGNGIGRELVLQLVNGGARVAAVDISETGMQETVKLAGSQGDKISTHVVDITNAVAVEALPEKVIAAHGSVDGLINNAGIIQPFVKVADLTFPQISKVFDVNFTGLMYMTKAFLPYLLKRPEAHIINLSSMGGFLPVPGQTIYGSSKAAVKLFTEGLHSELLETNVHVTLVFPGAIKTNITVNSGIMTQEQANKQDTGQFKMTEPDQAAQMIVSGIERNAYHVFVGSDSKMMDFLVRLAPKRAAKLIFDQMKSLLK
ncbi:MAG TPA: short-chain dehydrogenase [Anaerolineaceae bacterium]|nr:short-chain dehydrogenase [Anaerolineaceae bacterium]